LSFYNKELFYVFSYVAYVAKEKMWFYSILKPAQRQSTLRGRFSGNEHNFVLTIRQTAAFFHEVKFFGVFAVADINTRCLHGTANGKPAGKK
jgi:hypothetical protein